MKTLLAMRHAKSDWGAPHQGDHERPLNRRGTEAARNAGSFLDRTDLVPDLVVSSTAVRARTTAELAIEAGRWSTELRLEPDFYGSSVDEVVSILSGLPDVSRVLVVGHQPTWGGLVTRLTDEHVAMRTATIAVIAVPVASWSEVGSVRASLVGVHHPARSE